MSWFPARPRAHAGTEPSPTREGTDKPWPHADDPVEEVGRTTSAPLSPVPYLAAFGDAPLSFPSDPRTGLSHIGSGFAFTAAVGRVSCWGPCRQSYRMRPRRRRVHARRWRSGRFDRPERALCRRNHLGEACTTPRAEPPLLPLPLQPAPFRRMIESEIIIRLACGHIALGGVDWLHGHLNTGTSSLRERVAMPSPRPVLWPR